MYRSVLALLQKYVLPPASLLDVGCGFGGFLREAREAGYSVSGIDIVPEAVDAVRSQGFSAEQRFSLADVSFKHNSMDIISMLDVNMYFPDQPGELKSAYNLLRTKGFLVMRVVDKSWMFHLGLILSGIRPDLGQGMLRRAINDHRFSMPVKSLLKILKHSGFDVVYASPVGGLHSNNSSMAVKMSFAIGALVWSVSKRFMAPGALILAQKPAK
jgi:SAM-dependent methyltransferase